ncbi:MAG: twin-arginine translocase subunit TatC [Chromatiales bacterium]|jgi:sec-independent protein translocase protein TatC
MSESIDKEQPFIAHLMEMRDRLLRIVLAVVIILAILFPFANDIYEFIARPLMEKLPGEMIATGTITPFLTPLKLSLISSIFLAMPYILYQFWAFIAPGLYQHERKMVMPLVVSSTLLFYLGMAFAFYVVFPLVFAFIVSTAPDGVTVMTDMADYLDFVLTLFFAFGVAFEIPIATIILLWTGVTTRESLAKGRPYIIVGAFVIGMLLTPPDVISQVLLALPMWVLFEAGLIASRFFIRKREDEVPEPEDEVSEPEEEEGTTTQASSSSNDTGGQASEARGAAVDYPDDYVEPTEEEMEAALDSLDEEEQDESERQAPAEEPSADEVEGEADLYEQRYREEYDEEEEGYYDDEEDENADAIIEDLVDSKLNRIMSLRMEGDEEAARTLLYEVLSEGNEDQKRVARNILQQMDT